ncbi:MAG: ribosome maturation factor RimM [Chloroflexia bacterium]
MVIGRVVRSHGLSGEFKVEPLTDEPGRFLRLREAIIAGEVRRVLGARFANAQVLLRIEGVATVEEARLLNGEYISVPSEQAQPLEEGSYYHYQIIGLEVVTTGGEPIGVVAEIYRALTMCTLYGGWRGAHPCSAGDSQRDRPAGFQDGR